MDKLRYKITLITIIGTVALLGPILGSEGMSDLSVFSIPKSYIYIFSVWLLFIVISGIFIQKSKW